MSKAAARETLRLTDASASWLSARSWSSMVRLPLAAISIGRRVVIGMAAGRTGTLSACSSDMPEPFESLTVTRPSPTSPPISGRVRAVLLPGVSWTVWPAPDCSTITEALWVISTV